MMQLLDGKKVSEKLKLALAAEAALVSQQIGRKPHLVAILVGNDGGSETYVASKMKNCEAVGFQSTLIRFNETVTEAELLSQFEKLNNLFNPKGGTSIYFSDAFECSLNASTIMYLLFSKSVNASIVIFIYC